ncbi:MAG: ribonuclease PH, partial [Verrucomicrobia bacterium]|nr:ribonuclease PH [Verrucomicrobiota bacterium]
QLRRHPMRRLVGAISLGIVGGEVLMDLDYREDSSADTDMNVVMAEGGGLIEVQGTAEGAPFSKDELMEMMALAEKGIGELVEMQKAVLG